MITRPRRLAVVTLGTIALSLSTTTAGADGPAQSQHRLSYTASLQIVGGGVECDPTTPSRCIGSFQNLRTYTGGMTGTSYSAGTASLGSDGLYHGVAIELFTGSVDGCGDGTLVIRQIGDLDPTTGGGTGSWTIAADAGTGELAHASGGSVNGSASDESVAMIRC
jgi:hypothetical protein